MGQSLPVALMGVVHTPLPGSDTWTLPVPRLLVERLPGRFWAWLDREEFLVPKNVLDIVAGQTVTWMGLFFCPLLPLLNSVFIFLTFYVKKVRAHGLGGSRAPLSGTWRGLTSCICPPKPHRVASLGLTPGCLQMEANRPHCFCLLPSTTF